MNYSMIINSISRFIACLACLILAECIRTPVLTGEDAEYTKDVMTLPEDIIVNNVPADIRLPFYPGDDRNIRNIDPNGERIYCDNIRLKYRKNGLEKKTERLWADPKKARKGKSSRFIQAQAGQIRFSRQGYIPP